MKKKKRREWEINEIYEGGEVVCWAVGTIGPVGTAVFLFPSFLSFWANGAI